MAYVSLILPGPPVESTQGDIGAPIVRALEAAGHRVEVVRVARPDLRSEAVTKATPGRIVSTVRGLAAAATAGLVAARGELLIVLEDCRGYTPDDVRTVVGLLSEGRADLVVASRYAPGLGRRRALVGRVVRWLCRTSDPLSGLVGLNRTVLEGARPALSAIGSSFALELVTKVRGRRIEVPVRSAPAWRPLRLGWDDLKHFKRLSDHRFGVLSRLVQFCTVGASGMVIDLLCYAGFQHMLAGTELARYVIPPTKIHADWGLARVLAIGVALGWNFSLNRRLTFSDAREGPLFRQFAAYVASNLLSVVVSVGLSLGLPRKVAFFHDHKLMAALVGIVAGTALSFTMATWVFRKPKPAATPVPPHGEPAPAGLEAVAAPAR